MMAMVLERCQSTKTVQTLWQQERGVATHTNSQRLTKLRRNSGKRAIVHGATWIGLTTWNATYWHAKAKAAATAMLRLYLEDACVAAIGGG